MNSNTKGHGFFRKSKAYGLVCGIALAGVFAFNGGNVSADEVTAPSESQTVVTTLTEPTNNQAQA
ncbi:putative cross-wall-targeting lipoprotein signal domain-containing protein, partial [Streptococcus uberis]